jgi:hypothetical protein
VETRAVTRDVEPCSRGITRFLFCTIWVHILARRPGALIEHFRRVPYSLQVNAELRPISSSHQLPYQVCRGSHCRRFTLATFCTIFYHWVTMTVILSDSSCSRNIHFSYWLFGLNSSSCFGPERGTSSVHWALHVGGGGVQSPKRWFQLKKSRIMNTIHKVNKIVTKY